MYYIIYLEKCQSNFISIQQILYLLCTLYQNQLQDDSRYYSSGCARQHISLCVFDDEMGYVFVGNNCTIQNDQSEKIFVPKFSKRLRTKVNDFRLLLNEDW